MGTYSFIMQACTIGNVIYTEQLYQNFIRYNYE